MNLWLCIKILLHVTDRDQYGAYIKRSMRLVAIWGQGQMKVT